MTPADFADPIEHALALLRAAFPDVTFGNEPPKPAVDGRPPLPFVQISIDFSFGIPQSNPVVEVYNMRAVAWAANKADALQLAKDVRKALLGFAGDAEVQSYRQISGPLPYPNDGNPICVFTFKARLRPITL